MRGVQHFKTLCCIGLPRPVAMVAIAGALHEVIASEWNRIGFYEDDGTIGAGYAEHPGCVPLMINNIELFHGRDPWWGKNHPTWFARNAVGDLLNSQFLSSYAQTELFNAIERPLNVRWMLDSIQPLETGKLGIQLLRSQRDRPFKADDAIRFRALRPWIAHALKERSEPSLPDGGPSAVSLTATRPLQKATLVMDRAGRTLFRSEGAEYLISVLGGMDRELKSSPFSRLTDLPVSVREAVMNLLRTTRGQDAAIPECRVPTKWGTITVEASWLTPTTPELSDQSLIAVQLTLLEHAVAYAGRILRGAGATPAQLRVGVLLAMGKRKPEIARELGIKQSSVEDAARKLYARLDVHSSGEFSTLLWLTGFE